MSSVYALPMFETQIVAVSIIQIHVRIATAYTSNVDKDYKTGKSAPCPPVEKSTGEPGILKMQFIEPLYKRILASPSDADGNRQGKKSTKRTRKTKKRKREPKAQESHKEAQNSPNDSAKKPTLLRSFSESSFVELLQGKAKQHVVSAIKSEILGSCWARGESYVTAAM
ncbi:hypothetical protein PMIN03_004088 [Paraphaeosphaeria minitans]